jgi:hypothetical protein
MSSTPAPRVLAFTATPNLPDSAMALLEIRSIKKLKTVTKDLLDITPP